MEYNLSSGELLRLLDGDAISDEQRAAILTKLIDLELEKPEAEVDQNLIDECFAYLEELSEEPPKTEEELQAGLLRISFRAPMPIPMNRVRRRRPAAVIASALLVTAILVGSVLNLSQIAQENRHQETLSRWKNRLTELQLLHALQNADSQPNLLDELSGADPNLPAEARTSAYPSVAAWLTAEQLPNGTLYPDALPDGTRPKIIRHTVYEDGTFQAMFLYETAGIRFFVTDRDLAQYVLTGEQQRVAVGNCVFGVFQRSDGAYRANYQTGPYAYCLLAGDERTLLLTLYSIHGTGAG